VTTYYVTCETSAKFTIFTWLYANILSEDYPVQQGNNRLPGLPCLTLCHQVTLETLVLTHAYLLYTPSTGLLSLWLPCGIPYGLESSPL